MDILRKYTFLCSLVLVCLKCASAQDTTSALFSSWAKQHGYQFSGSEYGDRLATFASNLRLIENHALSGAPYSLGLTSFAHLTFDEFRSMYLSQDVSKSCASSTNPAAQLMVYPQTTDLPSSVDWRTQEKTFTPVKNKPSNCTSSSWALATAAVIETYYALNGGTLTILATQQLLDCADSAGAKGCAGGSAVQGFSYVSNGHPLMPESDYPSTPQAGTCAFDPAKGLVKVSSFKILPSGDERNMTIAVATNGPVTVAFHAAADLHLYTGGVYNATACPSSVDDTNHVAVVVGYKEVKADKAAPNDNYWILRNSWGPAWGLQGYFLLPKNVNACGVASCPSYPLVPTSSE